MITYCDNKNIKKIGRTFLNGSTLWLGLSGSGIKFLTNAKNFSVEFVGDSVTHIGRPAEPARMAVYIDGKRKADFVMDTPSKLLHFSHSNICLDCEGAPATDENGHIITSDELYEVHIIKLSECAMSLAGIGKIEFAGDDATLCPPADGSMKIEFIGDSITCGYGVDIDNPLVHFTTDTEDVTKAYAYKTASLLDAEYSMVSYSGYGIITGYTEDDIRRENQLVPTYYEKVGFSYAGIPYTANGASSHGTGSDGSGSSDARHADAKDINTAHSANKLINIQDIPWDFSIYQPDIVVINLGTNDHSYCKDNKERLGEFSDRYADFLKVIRKHNPNADILCVLGLMPVLNVPAVISAIDKYQKETADTRVHFLEIAAQTPEEGLAADYHPTPASHSRAAREVSGKIREIRNI